MNGKGPLDPAGPAGPSPGDTGPHEAHSPAARRSGKLLAEAVAALPSRQPASEAGVAIAELDASRWRRNTALAFVPLVGPLVLWRSEVHSASQRIVLSLLSILVTVAGVIFLSILLAPDPQRAKTVRGNVESQIELLRTLLEEYRARNGSYPDQAAWQSSVDRQDLRFFDPWGRAFLYSPDGAAGYAISTLGRDGLPGGSRENADISYGFSAAKPASPPRATPGQ